MPAWHASWPVRAAGLAVLLLATGCNEIADILRDEWSEADIEATWERGDTIIAALEKYRGANRGYPATLQDLVPDYLPEIPPPVVGGPEWVYQVRETGQVFDLGFGAPTDLAKPYSVYSSDSPRGGGWYVRSS